MEITASTEQPQTFRVCRNCRRDFQTRTGRGLCRKCWDDTGVRAKFPPLAPFGGREAHKFWPRKLRPRPALTKPVAAAIAAVSGTGLPACRWCGKGRLIQRTPHVRICSVCESTGIDPPAGLFCWLPWWVVGKVHDGEPVTSLECGDEETE